MQSNWITLLPTLNAILNGVATVFLIFGFWAVKFKADTKLHKKSMLSAFAFSIFFLIGYTIYHFNVGSIPFQGEGAIRIIYFVILIPHIILSAF